jgi:hypothetical protein
MVTAQSNQHVIQPPPEATFSKAGGFASIAWRMSKGAAGFIPSSAH